MSILETNAQTELGNCPRIEFLYKAGMELNIFGEHVTGNEVENIMTDRL